MSELYMQYGTMVLVAVLTAIAWLYMRYLHDKVKGTRLGQALLRLGQEIKAVILEVNTVYVDELKRGMEDDGKLSAEEIAKARAMALDKLKENYGPRGIKRLARIAGVGGAIDSWLGTQIEGSLQEMKEAQRLQRALPTATALPPKK